MTVQQIPATLPDVTEDAVAVYVTVKSGNRQVRLGDLWPDGDQPEQVTLKAVVAAVKREFFGLDLPLTAEVSLTRPDRDYQEGTAALPGIFQPSAWLTETVTVELG